MLIGANDGFVNFADDSDTDDVALGLVGFGVTDFVKYVVVVYDYAVTVYGFVAFDEFGNDGMDLSSSDGYHDSSTADVTVNSVRPMIVFDYLNGPGSRVYDGRPADSIDWPDDLSGIFVRVDGSTEVLVASRAGPASGGRGASV